MAEELGLDQAVGDGRAVQLDEGAVVAPADLVQVARELALSGPRLPLEEHEGVGRGDLLEPGDDLQHFGVRRDQTEPGLALEYGLPLAMLGAVADDQHHHTPPAHGQVHETAVKFVVPRSVGSLDLLPEGLQAGFREAGGRLLARGEDRQRKYGGQVPQRLQARGRRHAQQRASGVVQVEKAPVLLRNQHTALGLSGEQVQHRLDVFQHAASPRITRPFPFVPRNNATSCNESPPGTGKTLLRQRVCRTYTKPGVPIVPDARHCLRITPGVAQPATCRVTCCTADQGVTLWHVDCCKYKRKTCHTGPPD